MGASDNLSPQQFVANPHVDEGSAQRNYSEMMKARGGEVPEWGVAPVEHLDPSRLLHTQHLLKPSSIEHLESTPTHEHGVGLVIRSAGRDFIQDGHTRAHVAGLRGGTVAARVWDVDEQ